MTTVGRIVFGSNEANIFIDLNHAAREAVEGSNEASRFVIQADRFTIGDDPWQDNAGNAVAAPCWTTKPRPLVIIESPLAGDVEANTAYARACLLDCLQRGEAPIASHLLHTQVLDDLQPDERHLGIEAGLAWYRVANKCVVYNDRGISGGMRAGIARARQHGVTVEYRTLNERQVAA